MMTFSTDFQAPFSYTCHIWLNLGIGLALLVLFAVIRKLAGYLRTLRDTPRYRRISDARRQVYLDRLGEMDQSLGASGQTQRETYAQLSLLLREFALEASGTDTLTWTRGEIAAYLGRRLPDFARLMNEYTEPEFAEFSSGDAREAIARTKEAIRRWP